MSLPPLNLLLPHVYTFRDQFTDYPLLITSSSPSALITFILTYQVTEIPPQKSILIHYGDIGDALSPNAGTFFKSDAIRKGKFLEAACNVHVIEVKTLHELRALLFLITTRSEDTSEEDRTPLEQEDAAKDTAAETESVPDSEASGSDQEAYARPLLAISGMGRIHRDAEELSVQGLSRTLASALEAAGSAYHLILHGNEELDDELALMNDSSYLPTQLAIATTTFRKFYARFIACQWNLISQDSALQAVWRYLDGGGYRVTWEEDDCGQCSNSSIARLQES